MKVIFVLLFSLGVMNAQSVITAVPCTVGGQTGWCAILPPVQSLAAQPAPPPAPRPQPTRVFDPKDRALLEKIVALAERQGSVVTVQPHQAAQTVATPSVSQPQQPVVQSIVSQKTMDTIDRRLTALETGQNTHAERINQIGDRVVAVEGRANEALSAAQATANAEQQLRNAVRQYGTKDLKKVLNKK